MTASAAAASLRTPNFMMSPPQALPVNWFHDAGEALRQSGPLARTSAAEKSMAAHATVTQLISCAERQLRRYRRGLGLGRRIVIEDRRQPSVRLLDSPALALGVILDLVAADFT